MPGLNAAFVNVGYERDAFLHYLDLEPSSGLSRNIISRLWQKTGESCPCSQIQAPNRI